MTNMFYAPKICDICWVLIQPTDAVPDLFENHLQFHINHNHHKDGCAAIVNEFFVNGNEIVIHNSRCDCRD